MAATANRKCILTQFTLYTARVSGIISAYKYGCRSHIGSIGPFPFFVGHWLVVPMRPSGAIVRQSTGILLPMKICSKCGVFVYMEFIMSKVIHGTAHNAIKHFRKFPAALSVFMIYVSRTNIDNVAWPSLRGLKRDTGWSVNTCANAKQWLVDCKAIEPAKDYIRPQWRNLPENELKQRLGLDKSQYFRPTGTITIDGETYQMLYAPSNQESDDLTDVSPGTTSVACDISPDDTELDSIGFKGDSTKNQEPTQSAGPQSKFGYTIGDTAWWVDERDYRVTLHDGKITRFTAKMVEFTYVVDGKEYTTLRKPNSLSKTQPTLRRKTTPLQDMIALRLFNIEPNVAVGKQLAIRLKTIEGEIRTTYPTLTALDFKFACAIAGEFVPRDTVKVLAMIGEFYKRKNANAPAPSTTTAHDTRSKLGLVGGVE